MNQNEENILIEQIKEIIRTQRNPTGEYYWHRQIVSPPVAKEELAHAEAQLGFELPPFLRRLYLEVGNGGFGPGYGLQPLNSHNPFDESLVTDYLGMRSKSQEDIDEEYADEEVKPSRWPEFVLTICDWGCNIYSNLDCSSPDSPIFRMDSNVNFMVEWLIEAPSLQQWLANWVEGKPLSHVDWEQGVKVPVASLSKVRRV